MSTWRRRWGRSGIAVLLVGAAPSVALGSVHGDARMSASSGPTAAVVSATKGRDSVRVTARIFVPAKSGGASGRACRKESLTLATAGRHHKPARLHGTASAATGGCAAVLHGVLPKADFGKAVAFKLTVNGPLGKHATSLRLTIRTPPPPPAPPGTTAPTTTTPGATTPGSTAPPAPAPPLVVGPPTAVNGLWEGHLDPPLTQNMHVGVTAGVITDAYLIQNLTLKCTPVGGGPESLLYFGWSYPHPSPIAINAQGEFNDSAHKHVTPISGDQDLTYTLSGRLNTTTMPYTGTFTLSIAGTIVLAGEGKSCNATASGTLAKN